MRTLFVVGVLALAAPAARAEDPKPTVFVRVDGVKILKDGLIVTGLAEGQGSPVEWRGDFRDVPTVHPAIHLCTQLAYLAMQSPGLVKLEVSQPERWYPSCGLVRVQAVAERPAAKAP